MYNTLTDLMTGICDAVREKEGSSDLIPAPDIPERIRGISGSSDLFAGTANGRKVNTYVANSYFSFDVSNFLNITADGGKEQ